LRNSRHDQGVVVKPGAAGLFDLTGKVAVVTGGSRGIGRSIVLGLAGAGADVVVASRKLENCEAVVAEVEATTGRTAMAVSFNVGRWGDCDRLVDTVHDRFGRCDVLVSNAGMSPLYPDLQSVTEDLYDKTHAVNAKGPFRLAVRFGTMMAAGDGGSIINVSASGSWRPQTNYLPYAMAKAGLNALTLGLAGAWSPKVRANTVLPGPFDTDIAKAWPPGQLESIAAANPLGRPGRPDDMVGVCVFLASDAASYINGTQILVDGGAMRTL
jgi:NAD(P)-dependent dehydrogenase (short-subunit alcohol dehydrogenase family)